MKSINEIAREIANRKAPRGIHTEVQALVDDIRKGFGETAKSGVGSFGFYIRMINLVGIPAARMLFDQARKSDADSPKKLYVWMLREEIKSIRKIKNAKTQNQVSHSRVGGEEARQLPRGT